MAAGVDYCTSFPEGWWAACCKAHDAAYTAQVPKIDADVGLLTCVASSGPSLPSALVATLMFAGVALFGRRFYRRAKPE